jgi:hypothetical protein
MNLHKKFEDNLKEGIADIKKGTLPLADHQKQFLKELIKENKEKSYKLSNMKFLCKFIGFFCIPLHILFL